jgi:hypothetical protein
MEAPYRRCPRWLTTLTPMALLDTFKQKVLDLGRNEARAKAKPLLAGDETFDRSAAGLDRRVQEAFVLFWLMSDRALFLVAGGQPNDFVFRIPFEAVAEMSLDFDENAEFLPWYVRVALHQDGPGTITTFREEQPEGKPLAPPPPRAVTPDERIRFVRGEIVPMTGFFALPKKFRTTLARRLELTGVDLSITGAEAADRQWRTARRRTNG